MGCRKVFTGLEGALGVNSDMGMCSQDPITSDQTSLVLIYEVFLKFRHNVIFLRGCFAIGTTAEK